MMCSFIDEWSMIDKLKYKFMKVIGYVICYLLSLIMIIKLIIKLELIHILQTEEFK